MNWPHRLLVCVVIVVPGLVAKTGWLDREAKTKSQAVEASSSARSVLAWKEATDDTGRHSSLYKSGRARVLSSFVDRAGGASPDQEKKSGELDAGTPRLEDFEAIFARNVFGLQPAAAVAPPQPLIDPKEDLLLTGLAGFGSNRWALFMVTEPGKAPTCFHLREGESNEWLQVREIDFTKATVAAMLKKPFIRVRQTSAEVILSFKTHGAQAMPVVAALASAVVVDEPPTAHYQSGANPNVTLGRDISLRGPYADGRGQ